MDGCTHAHVCTHVYTHVYTHAHVYTQSIRRYKHELTVTGLAT